MKLTIYLMVAFILAGGGSSWEESLKSPDPEARSDACLNPEGKSPEAVERIAPLLGDSSLLVRHCAAYSLARIGGKRVEAIFRKGLTSSSYDRRRTSLLGLGMMGEKDLAERAAPLLRDKNWEVRWAAAFALGRSNDRRVLVLLASVAKADPYYDRRGENYPVREAARRAIRRLNQVIGWRTDPEAALLSARREGKPVLLYFRKTGSRLCGPLEKSLFTEEKVIDLAQRYTCVWLDYLASPAWFKRYGVERVPFIVLLTPAGRRGAEVEGTIAPLAFREKLRAVLESEKSLARLRSRRGKDPADLEAAFQLSELYMDEGQWDRAMSQLQALIRQDPYNQSSLLDNALFARAYIQGRRGNYARARESCAELLQRFSSFGDRDRTLYCLGLSALKAGEAEEGMSALEELWRQYPETDLACAAEKILARLSKK